MAVLVMAMHLLLLWLALKEGAWSRRAVVKQVSRVEVRLLVADETDARQRMQETLHKTPDRVQPRHVQHEAITLPRPSATGTPPDDKPPNEKAAMNGASRSTDFSVAPLEPAASGPESRQALDLQLHVPRRAGTNGESMVQQALRDPRSNTARLSPEQRLARALDQRVIEESLGNGRTRFRKGNTCVDARPSHLEQIDPTGQTLRPAPKLLADCSD